MELRPAHFRRTTPAAGSHGFCRRLDARGGISRRGGRSGGVRGLGSARAPGGQIAGRSEPIVGARSALRNARDRAPVRPRAAGRIGRGRRGESEAPGRVLGPRRASVCRACRGRGGLGGDPRGRARQPAGRSRDGARYRPRALLGTRRRAGVVLVRAIASGRWEPALDGRTGRLSLRPGSPGARTRAVGRGAARRVAGSEGKGDAGDGAGDRDLAQGRRSHRGRPRPGRIGLGARAGG